VTGASLVAAAAASTVGAWLLLTGGRRHPAAGMTSLDGTGERPRRDVEGKGAARAELCLTSERRWVARRFGRDFYGYTLVVRNRGPGEASSVVVAPVADRCGAWMPHLTGPGIELGGRATIRRLDAEASTRLVYETVCDELVITRCVLRWVDGSGERRAEVAVTRGW